MCTGCQPGYYSIDNNCNQDWLKCPDKECDEQTGECTKDGDCVGTTTYGSKYE